MNQLSKQTLELVCATFDAYLRSKNYSKQFREEIISEFEQYIEWIGIAPGGEDTPGAVVVPFERDRKG